MNVVRKTLATYAILVLAIVGTGASAATTSYMLTDHYGGSWVDAEKSPTNTEDDNLCWAAAASNVLDWTGWGHVDGLTNTDTIFKYYQDNWTDAGSLPVFGWEWFFTGNNTAQGVAGWAQVDGPEGEGGYYKSANYWNLFQDNMTATGWNTPVTMSKVDNYLRSGYGTTLAVYGPGIGHSVTVWGFSYDPGVSNYYTGVYITDSDDQISDTATDQLKYYAVNYNTDKWYLQDYYGSDQIYIGGVQALASAPVPEAATLLGFGIPMLMICLSQLCWTRK